MMLCEENFRRPQPPVQSCFDQKPSSQDWRGSYASFSDRLEVIARRELRRPCRHLLPEHSLTTLYGNGDSSRESPVRPFALRCGPLSLDSLRGLHPRTSLRVYEP